MRAVDAPASVGGEALEAICLAFAGPDEIDFGRAERVERFRSGQGCSDAAEKVSEPEHRQASRRDPRLRSWSKAIRRMGRTCGLHLCSSRKNRWSRYEGGIK